MNLTPQNQNFIREYNIDSSLIFDASHMLPQRYKAEMKKDGKLFAIGVEPCEQEHNFITRTGHCIICNPDRIQYMMKLGKQSQKREESYLSNIESSNPEQKANILEHLLGKKYGWASLYRSL